MNIIHGWYDIVDGWFGVTITIGIIAMIGGALYSIVRTLVAGDRKTKSPPQPD